MSQILTRLKINRSVYYWVIGGDIAKSVAKSDYKANIYLSYFKWIIVQAAYIKNDLELLGIRNVKVVPNFKKIDFDPSPIKTNSPVRFVYAARLIEQKGVGLIIEAARQLGPNGYILDFYGPPSTIYTKDFFEKLNLPPVKYKGFLNLHNNTGYEVLSSYDVMLFPTFFPGEGFPGVLIDAFIAGIPVVTTNFHANPEVINNFKNGIIISPGSFEPLKDVMYGFINGHFDLVSMKQEAVKSSKLYDINHVLSDKLLRELEIIN